MGEIIILLIFIILLGLIAGGKNGIQIARRGCLAIIILFMLFSWGIYELIESHDMPSYNPAPTPSTRALYDSEENNYEESYTSGISNYVSGQIEKQNGLSSSSESHFSDDDLDNELNQFTENESSKATDSDITDITSNQKAKNESMRFFVRSDHKELEETINKSSMSGNSLRWYSKGFSGWVVPSNEKKGNGCRVVYFTIDQNPKWRSDLEEHC